jgi:hypothetical protein
VLGAAAREHEPGEQERAQEHAERDEHREADPLDESVVGGGEQLGVGSDVVI